MKFTLKRKNNLFYEIRIKFVLLSIAKLLMEVNKNFGWMIASFVTILSKFKFISSKKCDILLKEFILMTLPLYRLKFNM